MFSAGFPFFWCTGSTCLAGGGGSATPRWALWNPGSSALPSAERPEDGDGAGLRGASEGSCRAAFPGKAAGRPH